MAGWDPKAWWMEIAIEVSVVALVIGVAVVVS